MFGRKKPDGIIAASRALKGRSTPMGVADAHFVSGHPLKGPYPASCQTMYVGMGCFWGAERLFWKLEGVFVTAVGYQGGHTPNPTYEEVCSGRTGHAETVMVVFDPERIALETLLRTFWENHDPTQGMAQGNDIGSQYRSVLFTMHAQQLAAARASRDAFARALASRGLGPITTEVRAADPFYFAETYHQQYLARNPGGYCGLKGTGVACPTGSA